jgi:hypothetical protein
MSEPRISRRSGSLCIHHIRYQLTKSNTWTNITLDRPEHRRPITRYNMYTKTLACLLLSLVTYTQAVAVAPLIDPSSAALNDPGSSIATRSTQDDALNWCRTEKGGVPLWYPNKDSDFKDLGQPGLVRVNDVREALLVGEPAGKKGTSPVLQARLAAMAAWAQVSSRALSILMCTVS